MAKIYALPKDIQAPSPDYKNYDHRKTIAQEEKFLDKLKAWACGRCEGELVGQIIREPRGDGYAQYMIFCQKPLAMFHLPLGDAWRASDAWERGFNIADARKQLKFREERQALMRAARNK